MASYTDKKALIGELARSVGMTDLPTSRTAASRFDLSTGTLYCDGRAVSKLMIDQAEAYFNQQKLQYMGLNDEGAKKLATYFQVAVEAIHFMRRGNQGEK